jgi:hypothetical protein
MGVNDKDTEETISGRISMGCSALIHYINDSLL